MFRGPHWALLGCEADRAAVAPRPGLRVHIVGPRGDVVDDGGHFRDAYGLSPGDWVLVRPDGYVGAIVGADNGPALERYLGEVGVTALARAARPTSTGPAAAPAFDVVGPIIDIGFSSGGFRLSPNTGQVARGK